MTERQYTQADLDAAEKKGADRAYEDLRAAAEDRKHFDMQRQELTLDEVRKMSPEQVLARKSEVDKLMATPGVFDASPSSDDDETDDADNGVYAALTLDDIRAGKYSDSELADRRGEVDALLEGSG